MNYQREVNFYLGEKVIKEPIYSDTQVKNLLGVSLAELKHLWVFSSKNRFKEAVKEFIHSGVKIDFQKANKERDNAN
jgi:hypothetical protein